MDEQEIPRNARPEFCDNPNVSPIEFNRNSSLIANKSHAFNISYEKCIDNDLDEKHPLLATTNDFALRETPLNTKITGHAWSLDLSYDDSEFFPVAACSYSSVEENLNKKIDLNDSLPRMDTESTNTCKRKCQSLIYKESKRRSVPKNINRSLLPNPIQLFQMDDEDGSSSCGNKSASQTDSSHLFDSFSNSDSMVLSPIAHEMSQLNGRELKDVSNFFQCDISSFE